MLSFDSAFLGRHRKTFLFTSLLLFLLLFFLGLISSSTEKFILNNTIMMVMIRKKREVLEVTSSLSALRWRLRRMGVLPYQVLRLSSSSLSNKNVISMHSNRTLCNVLVDGLTPSESGNEFFSLQRFPGQHFSATFAYDLFKSRSIPFRLTDEAI